MVHFKRKISVMKLEVLQSCSSPREYMSSKNPGFQKNEKEFKIKAKPKNEMHTQKTNIKKTNMF